MRRDDVANQTGRAAGEKRGDSRVRRYSSQGGQSIAQDMLWARVIAPSRISRKRAAYVAVEVVVATLVLFVICRLVDPADPLLVRTGFGWVWLVPIVLALRYGTIAGTASGLLLLACWYVSALGPIGPLTPGAHAGAHVRTAFPGAFFFGGFIATLLCGQFGDIWIGRQRQARVANDYLAERLSILTKNQFLLRLSHERLEQDLLARPATLRDSLGRLRALALRDDDPGALKGAARFLEATAQACQIETAALYEWRDGGVVATPAATVGSPFELDLADPLVVEALDKHALAHPRPAEGEVSGGDTRLQTRYQAVAPLLDAGGRRVALLVVERMPFLALTRDNLQFLLVLCGYYADGVRHAEITRALIEAFPGVPYDFALDYARLEHLHKDTGIESSLVALVFDASALSASLYEHVLRSRRSLDVQWPIAQQGQRAVLTLMPLSGEGAVDGYLLRIEENLRAQFGTDFETAHVATYSMRVGRAAPVEALLAFLRLCHVDR
jgi:hypothetical protein